MASAGGKKTYTAVKYVSKAEEMNARCRATMEDAMTFVDGFAGEDDSAFVGIFDGHGGRDVAEFVSANIASVLEEEMGKTSDMAHVWGTTYLTVDSMSHKAGHNTSGCTAVTCLVRRRGPDRHIFTANVGDARAVLARNGRAVRLTQDHKATDENEKRRIENAGGFVMRGRVVGMLAVSRSFGDHGLKQFVTAQPFTTETKLSSRDAFLICACDGLWDVFEDQEAVDFVADRVAGGKSSGTAQALIQQALARGSMDNISVIVTFFK